MGRVDNRRWVRKHEGMMLSEARLGRLGAAAVMVLASCLWVHGAEEGNPGPVAAKEEGWTQWRGPRRDGISDEKGLMQSWPAAGPKLIWSVEGLGTGWSSPIIAGGRIHITGDVEDELHIVALDMDGKRRWMAKNGAAWQGPYPGARACVRYADGAIYHMNAHGRVVCLDGQSGQEKWAVNVLERFDGKVITWGLAENLLVEGGRVIVTPGGEKAVMAALDAKTGQTVWQSGPLVFEKGADGASYASPRLMEVGGTRLIVSCSTRHVFGVDAETGRLLWRRPLQTKYEVIAMTPAVIGDCVFMTAPDSTDGRLLRVRMVGGNVDVEEVWKTTLDTCHGGVIPMDGVLFGSFYRANNGFAAIDAKTGKELYRSRELAMGSMVWADGRLYYLSQQGVMTLIKADAEGHEVVGRFKLVEGRKDDVWAHPVILDGRMYLRYHDRLYCYDVKAK